VCHTNIDRSRRRKVARDCLRLWPADRIAPRFTQRFRGLADFASQGTYYGVPETSALSRRNARCTRRVSPMSYRITSSLARAARRANSGACSPLSSTRIRQSVGKASSWHRSCWYTSSNPTSGTCSGCWDAEPFRLVQRRRMTMDSVTQAFFDSCPTSISSVINERDQRDAGPWLVMLGPASIALTIGMVAWLSKMSF
jgi:hypothetical protein